jgi:hypothetical protein
LSDDLALRNLAWPFTANHRERAMADDSLRDAARRAIHNGALPDRRPSRTWRGPGIGAPCTICERPATLDDLELEIEFDRAGDDPGVDRFHVHPRCFAAWELERTPEPAV